MDASTVRSWGRDFDAMWSKAGSCFSRRDLRHNARDYLHGLLSPVARKNSWQIADHVGDKTPYAMQKLLGTAVWDADQLRDCVREYVAGHLLTGRGVEAMEIDETGFLKKGEKSVGVQRQYSGTAGRVENCQIGVFLSVSSPLGRAFLDRELYLGKQWCNDPKRLRQAGVPKSRKFMTKPQIARMMIKRALDAGIKVTWVLGDTVYGTDYRTRELLESYGQAYVLAVPHRQQARVGPGKKKVRADRLVEQADQSTWTRLSVGDGTKGSRVYDWLWVSLGPSTHRGLERWVLARRSLQDPHEMAYYFCAGPPGTTLHELAKAAGMRWAIESCFETAKQEVGLDEYEVRLWGGWYRHITLSMLALAFLAALRAHANGTEPEKKTSLLDAGDGAGDTQITDDYRVAKAQ